MKYFTLLILPTLVVASVLPFGKLPLDIKQQKAGLLARGSEINQDNRQLICEGLGRRLSSNLTSKVKANLAANSQASWVSGTRMQALLEFDSPTMSVFHADYYKTVKSGRSRNIEVNDIAKTWLDKLPEDSKSMLNDGEAVGDTASVGVGFINAGFSQSYSSTIRTRFKTFAAREVDWLLLEGKRMSNGALSHRPASEPAQAWNDFVDMVPPFLAYYGTMNNNLTIATQAYKQVQLYRDLMRDPATNMWRHVTDNGHLSDDNHWGTGMAWTVAGISRVYATLQHSQFNYRLQAELQDLAKWANEIVLATFARQNSFSGLLPNAYNDAADSKWDETASTALLAATAFRMAQLGILQQEARIISQAEWMRKGIRGALDQETGWMWAVDPLHWYTKTDKSAESMAFVLLLEAAARDYRSLIDCKV